MELKGSDARGARRNRFSWFEGTRVKNKDKHLRHSWIFALLIGTGVSAFAAAHLVNIMDDVPRTPECRHRCCLD